ncbi:hypothetical protein [Variovorax sp. YR752]|uniref:hypothetical protein n=1 Tax=Variovorax sp. YR752 TaxID=1884383 RepID=UPI0031381465
MDRRVILANDVEQAAIDAQALAQRLASMGGIRPSVAAHAEQIDVAAKTLRDAAVALHGGLTPNLRLFFGRKLDSGEYVECDD